MRDLGFIAESNVLSAPFVIAVASRATGKCAEFSTTIPGETVDADVSRDFAASCTTSDHEKSHGTLSPICIFARSLFANLHSSCFDLHQCDHQGFDLRGQTKVDSAK